MKTFLVAVILFPGVAIATEKPLPTFSANKVGTPPLFLSAQTNPSPLALTFDPPAWTAAQTLSQLPKPKKVVSHMPVIEPRSDIDPKLRIAQPDPTIDYTMIVKTPALEPASK